MGILNIKQRHLRLLSRRFWGFVFGVVIAFAVLVQIGRQAFPLINDYRDAIAHTVGEQLGVQIDIENIEAEWRGLRPEVYLEKVRVSSKNGLQIFYIESAQAELSLFDSVVQGGLAWREVKFDGFVTTFKQNEELGWEIQGYSRQAPSSSNEFYFDDPLDIFLFGRRVEISNASLNFLFSTGKNTELSIPSISLDNDRFFHRLTAQLDIKKEEKMSLVIEGYGDPRDKDAFSAKAYVRLQNIPTSEVYNAVLPFPESPKFIAGDVQKNLNFELWLQGSTKAGFTGVGNIEVEGLPDKLSELDLPQKVSADITASWHDTNGWFLNLQDLAIDWQDNSVPLNSLSVYGVGKEIGLRLPTINLADWSKLALVVLKGKSQEAFELVEQLDLAGTLRSADIQYTGKDQGYFLAKAIIDNGSSSAYMGSPEFKNINGYIESSLNSGWASLAVEEDFSMDIIKTFNNPFVLDDVAGQLAWRVDIPNKIAFLNSSMLRGRHEEKEAKGVFSMTIPFKRDVGEPELTLLLNVDSANVNEYKKFMPKQIPSDLEEWLASAVVSGYGKDIDIFYHGSVEKDPIVAPTYQVWVDFEDLVLRFDEAWPAVKKAEGSFFLDTDKFVSFVDSAELKQNVIEDAKIQLVEGSRGYSISIASAASGDLHNARKLILNSALKSEVQDFLPDWDLSGPYSANVLLNIPLEADEDELDYWVDLDIRDAALTVNSLSLPFTSITGSLRYSKEALLVSSPLSLALWGKEFSADISSRMADETIELGFNGSVSWEDVKSWSLRPELLYHFGDFSVGGVLQIPVGESTPDAGIILELTSDLVGSTVDLPKPFYKRPEDSGLFELTVNVTDDKTDYLINLDNEARVWVRQSITEDVGIDAFIGDNSKALDVPELGFAHLAGYIDYVDYEQWYEKIEAYLLESERLNALQGIEEDTVLESYMHLELSQFDFFDHQFDDLVLDANGDEKRWIFSGASEGFRGNITVPADESEIILDIDYLSVYEELAEESELVVDSLADVDFSDLESFVVSIDELRYAGDDWGEWQFTVEPLGNGLRLNNLLGRVNHLYIGGEAGAQFEWRSDNGAHTSQFIGDIDAENIGDVLQAWEQERMLESESAHFIVNAGWPDAPGNVSLVNISGDIKLELLRGSFAQGEDTGENDLLRLIALFNFDTFARRLRLDFSDLAAKGFSYDKVSSELSFADGVVTLANPMLVESSSSTMQLAGTIDVVNETVDSELVVTLPVAGNIAVATAFIAGLPAGLGVYVVSKMFDKQVDKASSINYTVTGDWEDPKIKVKKIFGDDAARKKGESLREQKPIEENRDAEKALLL